MKEEREKLKEAINIYVFGSSLENNEPNDLDILLIYDSDRVKIDEILNFRTYLYNKLSKLLMIPIDLSILSIQEENELNFIECESAKELDIN
ncbi:nucleotidyltransferase domain-containing protein [Paenibacillus sp. N3.4]|uniref:nucleotidyltransferase domain-containing protein n=1 Tax=Paenibacillus sp. N3.4 TaxID=2603222 RepID=UPI0011C725AD|nr:nucleotidyltransferase domain-containing protein [Paenibacillus sp. N3.4]